ncbi:CD63 antigen-like isoform X2 [Apis laboriosa]|uniref:CD63 antigen-like isoform X2 n=1 Tax=Apis laboriosa TaxID=183418 RepID=UPI001CC6FAFA|nr:CD63 antigen-like isoform X2 [Apis laboriosa]
MNCISECIKYLLFIFNFIFMVCGLGILTLGVLVHLQILGVSKQIETGLAFPSITLIVLGSIIFVISFFGCCGAIRESHCMTITFASFLLFILLVQIAVAVYAFIIVKNDDNFRNISEKYQEIFNGYFLNSESKEFIDLVQKNLQCCGVHSSSDYNNKPIPASCCSTIENDKKTCSISNTYANGCVEVLKDTLKFAGTVFGSVAIAIAGVELIGIIFALCLANSIKNAERRGYRV